MKNLQGIKSNPQPENSRVIPGALFHFLVKGAETEGKYAVMDVTVLPGCEPPMHVHSHEDESYYITEGSINFLIGDETHAANAGDFIVMPKHLKHTFKVLTPSAKMLMLITPAGLDEWFWDNSAPAPDMQILPSLQGPPPADIVTHSIESLLTYGVKMTS